MKSWYLLSVIALATTLVASDGKAAEDCRLKQVGSLELTPAGDGIYTLPVTIAGVSKPFALALGHAFSDIATSVVDELKLSRRPMPHYANVGSWGQAALGTTDADISIDRVSGSHVEFLEFSHVGNPDQNFAGTIGAGILHSLDVELDLAHGAMKLFSQDHCKGRVVYWADLFAAVPFVVQQTGAIAFQMTLDGKLVKVRLETEGERAQMTMSAATRLFGITATSPGLVPLTRSGEATPTRFHYPFKSLSIGGVAILNPNIVIYVEDPGGKNCDGRVHVEGDHVVKCLAVSDIQLTTTELKQLHLYFAFEEKMLYATAANPADTQPAPAAQAAAPPH